MPDRQRFETHFDMLRRNLKHVFHGPGDNPFLDLVGALDRPQERSAARW